MGSATARGGSQTARGVGNEFSKYDIGGLQGQLGGGSTFGGGSMNNDSGAILFKGAVNSNTKVRPQFLIRLEAFVEDEVRNVPP
jgi:hypothetical protein